MDGKSHSQAKRGALLGGASHFDEKFPAFQVKAAPLLRCGGKLGVVHLGESSQQTGEKSIFERNGALLGAMRPTLWNSLLRGAFPHFGGGSPTLEATALLWWHGGKLRDRCFRAPWSNGWNSPLERRIPLSFEEWDPLLWEISLLFREIGPTLGIVVVLVAGKSRLVEAVVMAGFDLPREALLTPGAGPCGESAAFCQKSYPICNILLLDCDSYSIFGPISIITGLRETRKSENPAARRDGFRPTLPGPLCQSFGENGSDRREIRWRNFSTSS